MQTISDELLEILRSKFQAGARGFKGRIKMIFETTGPVACPLVVPTIVSSAFGSGEQTTAAPPATYQAPAPAFDALVYMIGGYRLGGTFIGADLALVGTDWNEIELEDNDPYESTHDMFVAGWTPVAAGELPPVWEITMTGNAPDVWGVVGIAVPTQETTIIQTSINPTVANSAVEFATPPAAGNVLIGLVGGSNTNDVPLGDTAEWTLITYQPHDDGSIGTAYTASYYHCVTQEEENAGKTEFGGIGGAFGSAGWGVAIECSSTALSDQLQTVIGPQHGPMVINIDKSLRMVADGASVSFVNEGLPLGWGPESIFETNRRVLVEQWYGHEVNAIRTFTGVIDSVHDSRDPIQVSLTLRDMMAILIDQGFSATAPQKAGEAGAVRTQANGVFLNMEVSDIVNALLDVAGWPAADRAITPTSYVLDEFILADGQKYAEAIIGKEKLTGLVGYSAWADEFGVFHFAPTFVSSPVTDPVVPDYIYRPGIDLVSLDDETDQYDLKTRVKVRGPLTTTTLQDTWRELWRTSKFKKPVGLWHDPTDPANLRVVDRGTKRLYKLRQSDRAILSSVYVGGICPHPLGLSGDPADAGVYWLLNAPWIDGISGGNSIKKVRKSDNHVLATFSLPSGNWSAIKVSSSYIWLTNLSTDRFYKRSKTSGAAIDDYRHTYASVLQSNPSGLMIDGTTLSLFWANGGSTARFLVCDESDPETITKIVKTAGTTLHGGEMDTVTHTECYGDSDSLGLVAKFTLKTAVSSTSEVYAEVINCPLEDELGELASLEPRTHDCHSGDPAHPYEIRRLTLDLSVITSLAQATETAQRQLDISSQRRRVVDAGIIAHPGIQKTDAIAVVDPITGVSSSFVVDTYRTNMAANGTYLGTLALLPLEEFDDTIVDEGDATDE